MWQVKKIELWIVIDPEGDAKLIHPQTREPAQFLTYAAAQFNADDLNKGEG